MAYKIKSGDTLSQIAKKHGTTIKKIMAANPSIKSANQISAGQSIKMPSTESSWYKPWTWTNRKSDNPYEGMSKSEMAANAKKKKKSKNIVGNPGKGNEMTKSSIPPKPKGGAGFDDPVDRKTKKKKKSSSADTDKKYFPGTNITPTKTQRKRMRKRMGGGT